MDIEVVETVLYSVMSEVHDVDDDIDTRINDRPLLTY